MKKIVLLLVAALLLTGAFQWLRYKRNDDFSITNIYGKMEHQEAWQEEPSAELLSLLNQNFSYLGKGCQSYVFLSQDERYVIKFLKHQHLRNDWWWEILPLPNSLSNHLEQKRKQKQEIFNAMAESSLIAMHALSKETGVLYAHMVTSQNLPTIHIIDKLGTVYSVNLNEIEFIIQKKALPALSLFQELEKNKDHQGFQQAMDKILALLVHRFKKGYYDNDRSTLQNVGFTQEGEAVLLDTGKLAAGAEGNQDALVEGMLLRRLGPIRKQIAKEFPLFLEDVEAIIEKYRSFFQRGDAETQRPGEEKITTEPQRAQREI